MTLEAVIRWGSSVYKGMFMDTPRRGFEHIGVVTLSIFKDGKGKLNLVVNLSKSLESSDVAKR